MAKLISKNSKRNIVKVRKRLDSEFVTLKLLGRPDQTLTAGEALMLGNQYLEGSEGYYALQVAIQLCDQYSDIIDVWLLRIRALLELEELVEAQRLIDSVWQFAHDNAGLRASAVQLKIILGDIESAVELLKRNISKDSCDIQSLLQLAECYRLTGARARAEKIVNKCLQITSKRRHKSAKAARQYDLTLFLLADERMLNESETVTLEKILGSEQGDPDRRSASAFALARQAERNKSIQKEMELLDQANYFHAQTIKGMLDNDEFTKFAELNLDKQKQVFNSANPSWLEGFHNEQVDTPIFIMGMPRSGTTLVEQMLGSHSKIGQTGESKALSIGITRSYLRHDPAYGLQEFPVRFERIPHKSLREIADYYVQHQAMLTDKKIYIDKELSCFKYTGLASHLFNGARFIHMNRPPFDIFLSCYKNGIPGIPSTANMAQLALYYIYMKKMIGYWIELYPEKIYVLDYAALVDDPEGEVRKVISFLGLDFESAMLDFHKRKNVVRTLSLNQVRQGVYKTSVKKWLPYADMLKPAMKILEQHNISEEGVHYL